MNHHDALDMAAGQFAMFAAAWDRDLELQPEGEVRLTMEACRNDVRDCAARLTELRDAMRQRTLTVRADRRPTTDEPDDVVRPVAPNTGADEMTLAAHQEDYHEVVVAKYLLDGPDRNGITQQIPTLVYRFAPTERQRQALVLGEDLYLAVLTFGRPALPLQLQVGPGSFQMVSRIVLDHDGSGKLILPGDVRQP